MIKLKELLNEESAMKAIINAKKGAKASGGGYSPWTKIGNNSWKNKKTGRLAHNAGLYDRIGEFSDFVIEGKLNEDYSQRARNFRVNLRTRLKAMKKNETVGIGKMIFSKMVDGNFQITKTGKVFGLEEVVQAIQKGPARPYIKTHRGAAGADMVNAYVKFGK